MRKSPNVFEYDQVRESAVGDAAAPDYIACNETVVCEFDDVYTAQQGAIGHCAILYGYDSEDSTLKNDYVPYCWAGNSRTVSARRVPADDPTVQSFRGRQTTQGRLATGRLASWRLAREKLVRRWFLTCRDRLLFSILSSSCLSGSRAGRYSVERCHQYVNHLV